MLLLYRRFVSPCIKGCEQDRIRTCKYCPYANDEVSFINQHRVKSFFEPVFVNTDIICQALVAFTNFATCSCVVWACVTSPVTFYWILPQSLTPQLFKELN